MGKKKFIQISNNTTSLIRVMPGIKLIDATNIYSPVKDRLNVKPAWMNMVVPIEMGVGWYPAEIADWDAVKSLSKLNQLVIGRETDGEGMPAEWVEKATAASKKLSAAIAKYEADVAKNAEILKADRERKGAE